MIIRKEHGFLRKADGRYKAFGIQGAGYTAGIAINATGDIAGFYENSSFHGLLRSVGTITSFGPPDSTSTFAFSINATDEVTVYYVGSSVVTSHGFLRDGAGTVTEFDPSGPHRTHLSHVRP